MVSLAIEYKKTKKEAEFDQKRQLKMNLQGHSAPANPNPVMRTYNLKIGMEGILKQSYFLNKKFTHYF